MFHFDGSSCRETLLEAQVMTLDLWGFSSSHLCGAVVVASAGVWPWA
ncbi:MAG: hypothetical protein JRI23_19540 [Deltaproteobacteria bacterium]|jgi:hypothetical protein|nr:hypothetical protein [Deltaproteobacteria bacterium]MBW2534059.1 hypothetical protein [Deltaproteobacteria bacterium]